jgi:hypothetical protein
MTTDTAPWQHVGEPTPPAGFYSGPDDLALPPDQAAWFRRMEAAEKAEQREREERLAERMEASHNRAVAEAIQRAHAAGQAWNPADPWRFYPTHAQRVEEAFAYMDHQAAVELRQAKAAAVRVLREHGVNAQVTVDASQPRPHLPGGLLESAAGEPSPSPEGSSDRSLPPGTAQRAAMPARGPGEASYNRLRIARFFDRVGRQKVNR